MKKLLAILGSPRTDGNLAHMLAEAVKEAEALGWQTETVDLYRLRIDFCRGCMGCKSDGICKRTGDDLAAVREKLLAADLVALASPTYFANVSAPVKNLFDRLVGAVMDDNDSPVPKPRLSHNKRYLLLTACNTPFPFDRLAGQSAGCLAAMREFFHISGMRSAGCAVFAGTRGKTEVPKRVLARIRRRVKRCAR